MSRIGVVGAGTWGMALARMLCVHGHCVQVWSAIPEEIDQLSTGRRQANLPYMQIPEPVRFTKDIQEVCAGKDILLFAVPSVYVRATAKNAAPFIKDGQVIVDVAKGIEADSLMTMSQVIKSEMHAQVQVAALSGPSHAEEVARDLPTAIVSACENIKTAEYVQSTFINEYFRVYSNDDIKGVELCGALKNIMALASGISTGLGYGDNAKAALITRGLAEMKRLGERRAQEAETHQRLMNDYCEALFTGVLEMNGRSVTYPNDGAPVTLSEFSGEYPYARIPVYQAFLNYCKLTSEAQERIRREYQRRYQDNAPELRHHRKDLPDGHRKGAAWRLSGENHPGRAAYHQ